MVVGFMLSNGADVTLADDDYDTALLAACASGLETIVRLLFDNVADIGV
jgi:ankyrin repeat protein